MVAIPFCLPFHYQLATLFSMSSTDTESDREHILWEQGDSDISAHSYDSPSIEATVPSSQTTSGLNTPMANIALSSQESTAFFPSLPTSILQKRRGRPCRGNKFRGNKYTTREKASFLLDDPSDTLPPKSKRIQYTLPRHGYTSRHSTPFEFRKQKTMFKTSSETVSKSASTPSGMRLLDVGILAEAMTKLRCSTCGKHLTLFESEHHHGWHTTFYIKCHSYHQLFAEFPSSKPMIPDVDKFVNVKLPDKAMNEVTMQSVLTVHCSGFSWRDLHKFATIFNMPTPLERMPQHYLNRIEGVVKLATEESMQGAADEIHCNFNTTPSSVPDYINTTVSFDSSWKTRGYYSNLGFGSAISALTKKSLITSYSITFVKNVFDGQLSGEKNILTNTRSGMIVTKPTVNQPYRIQPVNRLLQSGYGVDLSRNANSVIQLSSEMVTVRVTKRCVTWILTTESLFTKKNVWRMCLNDSRRGFAKSKRTPKNKPTSNSN